MLDTDMMKIPYLKGPGLIYNGSNILEMVQNEVIRVLKQQQENGSPGQHHGGFGLLNPQASDFMEALYLDLDDLAA
jgi:hypothetical protein